MVIDPQKLKEIRSKQPRVTLAAAYAQMEKHLNQSGKMHIGVKQMFSSRGRKVTAS
jgi:hypothetical protein